MRSRWLLFVCVAFLMGTSCFGEPGETKHIQKKFTQTEIHLLYPKGKVQAVLLIFPGLAFGMKQMQQQTDIIPLALSSGFLVVMPEMKHSLYCDTVFTCTAKSLSPQWGYGFVKQNVKPVTDSLLGCYKVPLFLYGLSTGCRGALRAGTGLFSPLGVALLSGDYCFALDTADALAKKFLGPYSLNRNRWENTGNLLPDAQKVKCRMLLATGEKDGVVKPMHTYTLQRKLPLPCSVFSDPGGGHNKAFWKKADAKAIKFYMGLLK